MAWDGSQRAIRGPGLLHCRELPQPSPSPFIPFGVYFMQGNSLQRTVPLTPERIGASEGGLAGRAAASEWSSWEIATKRPPDERGVDWKPRLLLNKDLDGITEKHLAKVATKMRLLERHGHPEASPFVDYEQCSKSQKRIWVLKAKPTIWRLYLAIFPERRQLIYLHAVAKKQWPRDMADCKTAMRRLEQFEEGGYTLERIELSAP